MLVLLRGAPDVAPPAGDACEEVQRVELALAPVTQAREICVGPGLMTSLRFDAPASVELQDEVRFEEVVRTRRLLTLLPPPDLSPGERLRLSVRFEGEASSSSIAFVLVAHPGQATHQVEVYRDPRTRESLQQEVLQERARNERLREELELTRAHLHESKGLRSLIASRLLGREGVQAQPLRVGTFPPSEGGLSLLAGTSFRGGKSVAVEVVLLNSGSEPWSVAGAALVDARGEELQRVAFRQDEVILPNARKSVVVEAEASERQARGELTLKLWDASGRAITIPEVSFP
ncbi:DUF2381 family protein [Archangium sp.]|uniref:DUF2381 family protein n=1 Tax=Archangium sp. TaxID=1872627 RepID=UPI003899B1FD